MTTADVILARGIQEILHFTTQNGLLGILDKRAVLSRYALPNDERLEFILNLNAPIVKDTKWEDYVNLSISRINPYYFRSSQRWHSQVGWRILSYRSEILDHPNVTFATTNNVYHGYVKRACGAEGLEALFADTIVGLNGNKFIRRSTTPSFHTTDNQAEVLYPSELSTEYLQCIYVRTGEDADFVQGQIDATGHRAVLVEIDPSKFL